MMPLAMNHGAFCYHPSVKPPKVGQNEYIMINTCEDVTLLGFLEHTASDIQIKLTIFTVKGDIYPQPIDYYLPKRKNDNSILLVNPTIYEYLGANADRKSQSKQPKFHDLPT